MATEKMWQPHEMENWRMYFDERSRNFEMEELEKMRQMLSDNNLSFNLEMETKLKEFKREWRQEMESGEGMDGWRSSVMRTREEDEEMKRRLREELMKEFEERDRKVSERERRAEAAEREVIGLLGQAKLQMDLMNYKLQQLDQKKRELAQKMEKEMAEKMEREILSREVQFKKKVTKAMAKKLAGERRNLANEMRKMEEAMERDREMLQRVMDQRVTTEMKPAREEETRPREEKGDATKWAAKQRDSGESSQENTRSRVGTEESESPRKREKATRLTNPEVLLRETLRAERLTSSGLSRSRGSGRDSVLEAEVKVEQRETGSTSSALTPSLPPASAELDNKALDPASGLDPESPRSPRTWWSTFLCLFCQKN